jgi:aspartyl/glutamyl-tRNA(Asn/Gln) amidotransferase C subunit
MISEEDFNALALLARLDPEDKSLQGLRNDFNKILEFVQNIQEVTDEVVTHRPPNETFNVTRKDSPGETIPVPTIQSIAPHWEAGHFVVPGVLDQEH